jgi:hypothetical protein
LVAVAKDRRLRFEIRERRFNVYYGGGSLMRVYERKQRWMFHFDEKYFKDGALKAPKLPTQVLAIKDVDAWVQAFPKLIEGMDCWWKRHPKGEQAHSHAIAEANSGMGGRPSGDYLVIDPEYQWAHRRLDMVAVKRRQTENDPTGWAEPDMVLIEVKSEYSACYGIAGLGDHACDYRDIITSSKGQHVQDIKLEYENVITQKTQLGLLKKSLGFICFSPAVLELLVVFVDLDPIVPQLLEPLCEVREVSDELGEAGHIRFIRLDSKNYVMTAAAAVSLEELVPESK